jgi:nucleotide-binding universal stress UspA family protein
MATVVVGVDYTGEGQAALEAGIEEARRRDAAIVLVHHVKVHPSDDRVLPQRQRAERLLGRAEAQATEAGLSAVTELGLGPESAATVLLREASSHAADVIVIGARKRSRVGKALMGSDAQLVILGADCHVLCVKDPRERDPILQD